MEMHPVESSNIAALGYDPERKVLAVRFRNGGVYEYLRVSKKLHEELAAAPSLGKFLNKRIRPFFEARRAMPPQELKE